MTIDDIIEGFDLLDDWEDRYRYLIELGRTLPPVAEEERNAATKVDGCASQVWLVSDVRPSGDGPRLEFRGESDAHIVRGLIAVLFALYSGRSASDILATQPSTTFDRLGLGAHLTPQRSNGLSAMVARIRREAERALADHAPSTVGR